MPFPKKRAITSLICLAAFVLPMTASADTTWRWDFRNITTNVHSMTYNTTVSGGPAVTVSGWANTAGSGSGAMLEANTLTTYGSSGLGMKNNDQPGETSPEHAFDNDTVYELVMMDFGTPIALQNIYLGYGHTDADISLLAYSPSDPSDTPNPNGVPYFGTTTEAASIEGLTDNGYVLVDNYDLYDSGGIYRSEVNRGAVPVESQYWIVAAYMKAFGDNWSIGNDHYKIKKVAGLQIDRPPTDVPVPPTFLLTALGLAWFGRKHLQCT